MLNKFKNIPGFVFYLTVISLSVIFFAVITFTPVSNIIRSFLKNDFISAFNQKNRENNNINLSETLIKLSFPGIKNYNASAEEISAPNTDISADPVKEKDYVYNPYENIPLKDDNSILSVYDLYAYYQASSGAKIEEAEKPQLFENLEIPPDYYKITPVNSSGQKTKVPKLLINNQTSFNNIDNIALSDYIAKKYPVQSFDPQKKDEPVILILNTHATESYVTAGTEYYSPPFTAERTTDINKNVVLIATQLRKKLEEYNIPVIQSTKLHDEISYKDSYMRSLETMNEYLEKYPSIRYIIDVHRDSMITSSGEKYKPTIKINGKDCSQIMLVIGTDDGGAYHPNWQDNLTFGVYLQQKLNNKYPMLARPINLRNARFNQHTTKGSVILEVGSCGSTFDEALYAADLFGECLAELLLEHNNNNN